MPNKFNFGRIIKDFEALKQTLPKEIGNESVNFFRDSFRKQGFQNGMGLQKWKEVQRRIDGTKAYKYPKKKDLGRRTRAILVGKGSGRLKRSIRMAGSSFNRTKIISDLPYSRVHNEGLGRMPKRQFMGRSRMLDLKVNTLIRNRLDKIFK